MLTVQYSALEETFQPPWTVFHDEPSRSLGTDGLHLPQRHVPQGAGVPASLLLKAVALHHPSHHDGHTGMATSFSITWRLFILTYKLVPL